MNDEKDSRSDTPEYLPEVVVVGTSAGGLKALQELISQLPADFPLPVLVVRHISPDATGNVLLNALNNVEVDHCLPISEMGAMLLKLISLEVESHGPVPEDILVEARIAERVLYRCAS